MGTTLKLGDFVNVFKNPKEITVGISAQYVIMPIIAFLLARVFSLNDALTVGLILVGTVPEELLQMSSHFFPRVMWHYLFL